MIVQPNTVSVFLQQSALVQTICKICKRGILVSIFALMLKTLARWQPWIFCGQSVCQFRFDFVLHWEPVDSCILLCKNIGIGIGIDCGSNDALHPFWGLFLGLQPSRSAARPRPQEKCIQRIILTTVANTQREGSHTIRWRCYCNCQFKEGITTYNIRLVCTVIWCWDCLLYTSPSPRD